MWDEAFCCAEHPVDADLQVAGPGLDDAVRAEQQGIATAQMAIHAGKSSAGHDAEQRTRDSVQHVPPSGTG